MRSVRPLVLFTVGPDVVQGGTVPGLWFVVSAARRELPPSRTTHADATSTKHHVATDAPILAYAVPNNKITPQLHNAAS